MNGWIKKHRKIMSHWLYEEERVFSRYEAFDYLLMIVNHQDNKIMMDGKLVDVERGTTITSVRKLCERWRWSNTKVVQFLEALEADGMIEKKSDTKKTVITIVNYGKYQGSDEEETTPKRHENDTETIQKHTNKNLKNDKNEKKVKEITYTSDFELFWDAYPKKNGKPAAFNNWKKLLKKHSAEYLIGCGMNYASYCIANGTDNQYMKMPNNFLNAKDEYYKQFETPALIHSKGGGNGAKYGTSSQNAQSGGNQAQGRYVQDEWAGVEGKYGLPQVQ